MTEWLSQEIQGGKLISFLPLAIEYVEHVFDVHSLVYNDPSIAGCRLQRSSFGRKWVRLVYTGCCTEENSPRILE